MFDKLKRGARHLVESRQVFNPNGKTLRTFEGRILGAFRRAGPNPWDPYHLVPQDGPVVEVLPGVKVQIEEQGIRFRMRVRGAVHVIEWQPPEEALQGPEAQDLRAFFLASYVQPFQHKAGIGAAAFIARTLR